MNPEMPRCVVETQRYLQNRFPGFVVDRQVSALRQRANGLQNFTHRLVRQALRKTVHFTRRHAKHFCHFAHGEPRVHGDEVCDHRDMLFAPVFVHIIEQLVAARRKYQCQCPGNRHAARSKNVRSTAPTATGTHAKFPGNTSPWNSPPTRAPPRESRAAVPPSRCPTRAENTATGSTS